MAGTTIHIATLNIYSVDTDRVLDALSELRTTLMAVAASTQAKLDALTTLINDTGTKLSAAADGIAADIADLKAKIVASGPGSTAEIDAALDALTDKARALAATSQALADLDATTTPGDVPPPEPEV